jgi:hypothetical protein
LDVPTLRRTPFLWQAWNELVLQTGFYLQIALITEFGLLLALVELQ